MNDLTTAEVSALLATLAPVSGVTPPDLNKEQRADLCRRLQKALNDRGDYVPRWLRAETSAKAQVAKGGPQEPLLMPPTQQRDEFPFAGTLVLGNLIIDVENARGSWREGKGWRTYMRAHYGEIRGTEGRDGDAVDAYVGPDAHSRLVVVVHQKDPDTGRPDEDKVMLGWPTAEDAVAAYKAQYDRPGFYGGHTVMDMDAFTAKVYDPNRQGKMIKSAGLFGALVSTVQAPYFEIELPDAYGEALYEEELQKGLGHKYIKRIPTSNPKRPWRYIYTVTGVGQAKHLNLGTKVAHGAGHYEVTREHEDGTITVKHDVTGDEHRMTREELAKKLLEHHAKELREAKARTRAKRAEAARRGVKQAEEHAARANQAKAEERAKEAASEAMTPDQSVAKMRQEYEAAEDKAAFLKRQIETSARMTQKYPEGHYAHAIAQARLDEARKLAAAEEPRPAKAPKKRAEKPAEKPAEKQSADEKHTYAGTIRPVGAFTVPEGGELGHHPDYKHGIVTYDKALSLEDAEHFSLRKLPTDSQYKKMVADVSEKAGETIRSEHEESGTADPDDHRMGIMHYAESMHGDVAMDSKKFVQDVIDHALKAKETPKPAPTVAVKGLDGKLEQTGDHIWGSRKDLATKRSIESSAELDGMSYDDAAAIVRKSKLVEPIDLEQAKASGMTPGATHAMLSLMAAVREKPGASHAERVAYVDDIRQIQGALKRVKTLNDFAMLRRELHMARKGAKAWAVVTSASNKDELQAKLQALQRDNPDVEYRFRQTSYYGPTEIIEPAPRPFDSLGSKFVAFIERRGDSQTQAMARAMELDGLGGQKMSPEDAWGWLTSPKASGTPKPKVDGDTVRGWSGAKEVAGEVVRTGGRPVSGASADRTKKTFNLREVDYGQSGYMTQADREYHTEALEGGLHDLAEVLGLPPEQVSFKGRLGIALGARGAGKAAAHYEGGRHVINITKFRGGGSLAHEWGHALDDIVGRHYLPEGKDKKDRVMLSLQPEHSSLPAPLASAIQGVVEAMERHPNPKAAKAAHEEHVKKLTKKANDLIEQSNALVAEHSELQRKPLNQEELGKKVARAQENIKRYEAEIATLKEENAKDQKAKKRSAARDVEISNRAYWIKKAQEHIERLHKEGVQTPEDQEKAASIFRQVEALKTDINRAKDTLSRARSVDPTKSDYHHSAQALGDYWGSRQEMFARAFESYVEDKLRANKRQSTYLVDGTRVLYPTNKEIRDGQRAQPYPHGAERENIVAAFDKLMAAVRDGKHMEKALQGGLFATLIKAVN